VSVAPPKKFRMDFMRPPREAWVASASATGLELLMPLTAGFRNENRSLETLLSVGSEIVDGAVV
jgi:hypothetical protein